MRRTTDLHRIEQPARNSWSGLKVTKEKQVQKRTGQVDKRRYVAEIQQGDDQVRPADKIDQGQKESHHSVSVVNGAGKKARKRTGGNKKASRSHSQKPTSPPQNRPTSRTARSMNDPAFGQPLVSETDIKARWDKKLLSGGRHTGSVSR